MKPFALSMQSISNLAGYSNFLYSSALFIPYFHIHVLFLCTYSLMLPINSLIFSCSWYIVSLSNRDNCWKMTSRPQDGENFKGSIPRENREGNMLKHERRPGFSHSRFTN